MIYLRRLLSKFWGLFHNARVEEELEREITAHLALLEDDFLRKGMSAEEAHLAARRAYGGVEQAKQLHRDERSILWLEQLRQDVRYAFRQLGKSPGFTVVAIVTFALGIGANTAIFSLADLIIRRPVSLPGLDRLVSMEEQSSTSEDKGISAANYLDLLAANHSFEQLAVYEYWSAGVGGGGQDQPYEAIGVRVSANFFSTVGIKPTIGRDFIAGEDAEGRDREVILSNAFWRRRFAGDPSAVGKLLNLDGEIYAVIGVMPARGIFPLGAPAFWVPIAMSQRMRGERQRLSLHAVGRLQTGVSLEQARGEINGIWNSLAKSYPRANANRSMLLVGLRDSIVLDYNRQFSLLLMGVVGFVLLNRLHEHCHPAICARLWAATGDCDSRSSWSKPLAGPTPTADGEHFAVAVGRCSRFNPVHLQRSSLAKHAASGCAVVLRCKQSEGEWGRIRFHGAFGYRVRCAVWIGSGVEVFES